MTKIIKDEEFEQPRYYWITKDRYYPGREYFAINGQSDENKAKRLARWIMGGIVGGLLLDCALSIEDQKQPENHEVAFDLNRFCTVYEVEREAVLAVVNKFRLLPKPIFIEFDITENNKVLAKINPLLVKNRTDYIEKKFFHLHMESNLESVDWENSDGLKPIPNQEDQAFLKKCAFFGDDLNDWILYENLKRLRGKDV